MLEQQIQQDRLKLLYSSSWRAIPFNIIIASLFALDFWYNQTPFVIVISWWAVLTLVSVVRLVHMQLIDTRKLYLSRPRETLLLFISLTFLTGLIWGSSYFIFSPFVTYRHEILIILILGGMSAGAVVALSSYLLAYYAYVIPMFIPLIVYHYAKLEFDQAIAATMFLFFVIMVSVTARLNNQLITRTLELNWKKDELIDELSTSHRQLQEAYQRIEELSHTDALTGLPNRRDFEMILKKEWNRAQRNQQALSLLMIDLDNFKLINDRYGHPFGDIYLREVAMLLKSNLKRASDYIARFGGDEFAAILPGLSATEANKFANDLRQSFLNFEKKAPYGVFLSIGVGHMYPKLGNKYQNLIDIADKALYTAKKLGKNQVVMGDIKN